MTEDILHFQKAETFFFLRAIEIRNNNGAGMKQFFYSLPSPHFHLRAEILFVPSLTGTHKYPSH